MPPMLLLLVAGCLLGPYVLGAVDLELDDTGLELLFTLGVSFILFYGGLGLSLHVLRRVVLGLGLLAVPGVLITAVVTGLGASWAFGIPVDQGILIGAVLAPTDPAILIPLFERTRVRPKVAQTIIAESALNDPTGAVLALSVAAFVVGGGGSFDEPLIEFVKAIAISVVVGTALGLVLALAISHRWLGFWRESPAIAVLLVVTGGYFTIDTAGGQRLPRRLHRRGDRRQPRRPRPRHAYPSGSVVALVRGRRVGRDGDLRLRCARRESAARVSR